VEVFIFCSSGKSSVGNVAICSYCFVIPGISKDWYIKVGFIYVTTRVWRIRKFRRVHIQEGGNVVSVSWNDSAATCCRQVEGMDSAHVSAGKCCSFFCNFVIFVLILTDLLGILASSSKSHTNHCVQCLCKWEAQPRYMYQWIKKCTKNRFEEQNVESRRAEGVILLYSSPNHHVSSILHQWKTWEPKPQVGRDCYGRSHMPRKHSS